MKRTLTEFDDLTNFLSSKYLNINSCEKSRIKNRTYTILRSKGRVDFQIIYVNSGVLKAEIDGEKINVKEGGVIIYKPHQKQLYTFDDPKIETYWVHFSGIGAEEILKRANLWIKSVYNLKGENNVGKIFDELIKEQTLKNYQYQMMCEAKLVELISEISRCATEAYISGNSGLIYEIIEKMRDDSAADASIYDYAKMCSLSRSRFEHLFKEVTHLSPRMYQTKIRLDRACYLLSNTNLNISEISNMTGYSDALYFSRLFHKKIGISPTEYRLKNQDK